MSLRAQALLIFAAALPAVAGAALLVRAQTSDDRGSHATAASQSSGLRATSGELVCSLSNADARAAGIEGADGGLAVTASDGQTYWLFGDTLFSAGTGKQIEPNAIALSHGADADGCPVLAYHAGGNVAVPFIEKDGALTVWPSGAWPLRDGTIDIYIVYVYGTGPFGYWIGEVGLGRLHTGSMRVQILARRLFDGTSGHRSQVVAALPVDLDGNGRLRVLLELDDGEKLLSRVDPGRMAERAAYEYWDGAGWTADAASADPLWPAPGARTPVEELAAFESGAHVAWNGYLQRYVAIVNAGFAAIGARTAERLEGPWTDVTPLLDCTAFAAPAVPVCYSAYQHPELSPNGGRTLVLTLTRMATYDTVVYAVVLDNAADETKPVAISGEEE